MRLRQEIDVARPPAEAFAYVSDFSNSAQWDPGIAESYKETDGPIRVGTVFRIVAVFRGNRQPFRYEVTELDEGRRIVLEGDGDKARSTDAISVEAAGSGTRLVYEADLRLKGARRAAEPFLRGMMERMGRAALAGLKAELNGPG